MFSDIALFDQETVIEADVFLNYIRAVPLLTLTIDYRLNILLNCIN